MKRLIPIFVLIMVAVLIGFSNQAATEEKVIELKITNHNPPLHLITKSIREAFEPLEEMSRERVKVKFFDAGSLAKGRESYDAVLGGVADMGWISCGYWPGRFPLISIGEMPGIFPNGIIGTRALRELINTTPYIKKEFGDVKILGLAASASYRLMLKKKITTVDKIKGLRLRTAGGFQTKTLKKLGAVPVMMSSGEVYTSLSRGLLDGAPYVLSSVPPYRFHEVINYVVDNLLFGGVIVGMVMNKDSWAKLPSDIQTMVAECGKHMATLCAQWWEVDSGLAIPFLRNKGIEVYSFPREEEEKFYAALKPVRDEWVADMTAKGLPGKETSDALNEITKKLVEKWE